MKMHRGALLVVLALPLAASSAQRGAAAGASPQAASSTLVAAPASEATIKAVAAAKAFLAKLDDRQRSKVSLALNKSTRSNWSNLPTGVTFQNGATERNGARFGDMSAAQQEAALALVAATLSPSGYQKVINIVNADETLERQSAPVRAAGNRVKFGRAEYHVAILGAPSTTEPWMIQFGGHHLAINISVVGGENVLTPSHTGAQPASYSLNGQTIRPLGKENDKAFDLMKLLSAAQQEQAILNYQVSDVVLGPGHDGEVIQPEGIRASGFTLFQQEQLLSLMSEWVGILNDASAAAKMAEVRANLSDTYFAWSGPTTNGSRAYFRIQGPTVMIEYAPQGTTDHIHTFYRDPANDYAAKFLKP